MADFAVEQLRQGLAPRPVPAAVTNAVVAEGPALRARHRARIARRAAVVLVIVLALTAASFTPPGRAATGWISELIAGPNTFELGQYGYQLHNSTLVGSGTLPTGDEYQLRGYINDNGSGKPAGCVAIVWEQSDHAPGKCLPAGHEDQFPSGVGRLPEDEMHATAHGVAVFGVAPYASTDVRIRVPASPGVSPSDEPARLYPIDGRISDATGASVEVPRVKMFVGYLPPGAGNFRNAPPAHAVALEGGREIRDTELSWIRFKPEGGRSDYVTACVDRDPLCQQLADQGGGNP